MMNKKKVMIAGGIIVALIIVVIIVASVNTGTKKQKDKVTTVTPTTTGIGESSLTASTGSSDNITEKNSDSGETAANKTYGNNQGDNYAVDIFTDKAVENKTKKTSETKKNGETKKPEKNQTEEKTTKDGQPDKNDPNSDDGWTDFY